MTKKTIAIIPAYNEASNIASVIAEIRQAITLDEIVVIDDGSVDATASVAGRAGVTVLRLPFNMGIGSTVQVGYMYAAQNDYDLVVRLDGDGQHDPADLKRLMYPVLNENSDMSIGSRFLDSSGYKSSFMRMIGIHYFRFLTTILTGQKFTDPTSGFHVYNRNAILFLEKHTPSDYPEIEGLVLLKRARFKVSEVPVTMRPRYSGKSSIKPVASIYYMLKVTLALAINLLRADVTK